jgi:pimeloyl-ACP methyl ester carboxylesterase
MLEKLVLVATSSGGSVHVPASQEVLALLAPTPGEEAGERAIHVYSQIMAAEFVAAHPAEMERIAETARYRPQSAAAYMRQLRASLSHDVADSLHRITAPTLVIHGGADPLVPTPNGAYLAAHIPGAQSIVYPGVGHIPIVERADEFNRDVLAFLAAD